MSLLLVVKDLQSECRAQQTKRVENFKSELQPTKFFKTTETATFSVKLYGLTG